jgi:hypothetical protein
MMTLAAYPEDVMIEPDMNFFIDWLVSQLTIPDRRSLQAAALAHTRRLEQRIYLTGDEAILHATLLQFLDSMTGNC